MSPMSSCKSKGIHYMVQDRRNGFACLLCGLAGSVEVIKANKCVASSSLPTSEPALVSQTLLPPPGLDQEDSEVKVFRNWQAEEQVRRDREMAEQLMELQKEEARVEQLLLLQRLEHEESLLEALVREQQAVALAEAQAKQMAEQQSHDEVVDSKAGPDSFVKRGAACMDLPSMQSLMGEPCENDTLPSGTSAATCTYNDYSYRHCSCDRTVFIACEPPAKPRLRQHGDVPDARPPHGD